MEYFDFLEFAEIMKNIPSFYQMEYFDFLEFVEIMKTVPSFYEIDDLCKSNSNFAYLDSLKSQGYFKLLTPIQIYSLFTTACAYESVDIAMLLYSNQIDMEGVKELMLNFMCVEGTNSEYVIFRWIWEKNQINFTSEEINGCLIQILKSGNLEFIEWFCNLPNIITWNDNKLKNQIGTNVLEFLDSNEDYMIGKYICEKYIDNP